MVTEVEQIYKYGEELCDYIKDEFLSYGVDFDITSFVEVYYGIQTLILCLYGRQVPEDVEKSDEEVLDKFLSNITSKFISSHDSDNKFTTKYIKASINDFPQSYTTDFGEGHVDGVMASFFLNLYFEYIEV